MYEVPICKICDVAIKYCANVQSVYILNSFVYL